MNKFDLNAGRQELSAISTLELQKESFLIGSKEYTPNATQAYFTFTIANSWPEVNDNIVGFSVKTLLRSYATVQHEPIDVDHQLEGNGIMLMDGNKIIGHMIDASLVEDKDGSNSILVAGVLYKRTKQAQDIIMDIASGGSEWKISMEVLYKPAESGFMFADNSYVPLEDAEEGLITAYQNGSTIYEGQKYGFLAGGLGEDGEGANVSFWGAALTMSPADENAVIHTMVATKLPNALMGATVPKVIVFSDGPVESTRLLIDGVEIEKLMDVDFSSWPGYDEKIWLQWTTEPEDIGGVMKNSRYTLIANKIIGDIGMSKIKEFMENYQTQVSEAVDKAVAALKGGDTLTAEAVKAIISEKIGELKDFISPDELDAKAEELATKKIEKRDALAAALEVRVAKAEKAGVVINDERRVTLASLEEDKVDAWIEKAKNDFQEMVASLEKEHKVTFGEDATDPLKRFAGIDSPEFGAYKAAIAIAVKTGASLEAEDVENGGTENDKNKPSGW